MKLNCGSRIIEQLFSGPAVKGEPYSARAPRREPDVKFILGWIRRVSDLGLDSLCLWIPSERNLELVSQDESTEKIRLSCEQRSVTIDNLAVSFLSPWTSERVDSGRIERAWSRLAGFADAVGAEVLEMLSPSLPASGPSFSWTKAWSAYTSRMRQYARLAETHGLRLAVEPRPMDILGNTDALLRLMDVVTSESLGAVIDFGHVQMAREEPTLAVRKLAGRTFSVHLSDYDGITDSHWPPGQGIIDWYPIFAALRAAKYDGILSLDVSGMDVEQEVIEAREYVEEIMRKAR